ncbi:PREDICTED: protein EARLY FLOWERING 3 isoform X2 [Prunus mume]|uniref:Protein EARLY FLOWERING 3 isoform X2 n=1 Tax=Prunus mume TaxID=102107 RepID=A0ABM0PUN8_PRUMU|nr:PREDICTED: protein EARLY FLOWERING 3 isoform X2 [Prunus mume]
MRGGKDEEHLISPVFPRFHVNDTDKGGPRPPPRNKMALYEQFSIPSQSFTSGSASMLPLPHNDRRLVPPTSWSDVSSNERNILTPPCNFLVVPSDPAEKIQSYDPTGANLNTMMADCERISTKPSNYLNTTGPSSSAAKYDSFQPKKTSHFRNFSLEKYGNEDYLKVPSPFQGTALQCRNSQQSKEKEKLPCLSSMEQLKSSCIKKINGSNTIDLKLRQCGRNHEEENPKVSQTNEDPVERSVSLALAIVKDFANTSSSPSNTVKNSESLKRAHASLSQENRSSVNDLSKLCSSSARLHRESMTVHDRVALRDGILVQSRIGTAKEISSKVREKSCLTPSLVDDNRISGGLGNENECCEEKCGVAQVGNLCGHEDISDMSIMDCNSAMGISPHDVMGVIGAKQFCEMRKAIVSQQRVFAVQVFELHRLIKVQRLIAGSPHLLLEDNDFLSKPAIKVPPVKKVPLEHALELPPLIVKPKDHPQKPHSSGECVEENAVGKFPLPPVNNRTSSRGLVTQQPYSKPALWCLQPPPGNMWFVPVTSSSEELAYQPYTGRCAPTGGFMAPMYGSCGPASLNPGARDYLNATYSNPSLYQQGMGIGTPPLLQTCFPPYGMPIINPSLSSSAVENMTPFSGGHSNWHENQLSFGEINFTLPHQSSCNMSGQMSQVMPCYVGNIQASKGSEIQGTTASSPSDRTLGNALPLFPTAPQSQEPCKSEHQTRAIKVVPHNTKSASESAARIFLSIQEERK